MILYICIYKHIHLHADKYKYDSLTSQTKGLSNGYKVYCGKWNCVL